MARRGFYEEYQREKNNENQRDRPAIIRRNAGTAIMSFFHKFFTAVLYFTASVLSSVGLTTLINKPLRDMLAELVKKTFFGG